MNLEEVERVVFDAEPFIAHADDESGSRGVDHVIQAVKNGSIKGYISTVNLAEVEYILARKFDRDIATGYLRQIAKKQFEVVDTQEVWQLIPDYKLRYNPSLADAFALATAQHLNATLFVGSDDDYDEVTDVKIERFRETVDGTPTNQLASLISSLASDGVVFTLAGVLGNDEESKWRVQAEDLIETNGDTAHIISLEPETMDIQEGPLTIAIKLGPPKRFSYLALFINGEPTELNPNGINIVSATGKKTKDNAINSSYEFTEQMIHCGKYSTFRCSAYSILEIGLSILPCATSSFSIRQIVAQGNISSRAFGEVDSEGKMVAVPPSATDPNWVGRNQRSDSVDDEALSLTRVLLLSNHTVP